MEASFYLIALLLFLRLVHLAQNLNLTTVICYLNHQNRTMRNSNTLRLVALLYLFAIGCRSNEKNNIITNSYVKEKTNKDSIAESIVAKFSLPYSDILKADSNSLFFYCSRAYDTSSLIHIQKGPTEIRGIFYQMLPTIVFQMISMTLKQNYYFLKGIAS